MLFIVYPLFFHMHDIRSKTKQRYVHTVYCTFYCFCFFCHMWCKRISMWLLCRFCFRAKRLAAPYEHNGSHIHAVHVAFLLYMPREHVVFGYNELELNGACMKSKQRASVTLSMVLHAIRPLWNCSGKLQGWVFFQKCFGRAYNHAKHRTNRIAIGYTRHGKTTSSKHFFPKHSWNCFILRITFSS